MTMIKVLHQYLEEQLPNAAFMETSIEDNPTPIPTLIIASSAKQTIITIETNIVTIRNLDGNFHGKTHWKDLNAEITHYDLNNPDSIRALTLNLKTNH